MSLDQLPTIGLVAKVQRAAGDSRTELIALFQAPLIGSRRAMQSLPPFCSEVSGASRRGMRVSIAL